MFDLKTRCDGGWLPSVPVGELKESRCLPTLPRSYGSYSYGSESCAMPATLRHRTARLACPATNNTSATSSVSEIQPEIYMAGPKQGTAVLLGILYLMVQADLSCAPKMTSLS